MDYKELKESLSKENKRLQCINGYKEDGTLDVSMPRGIDEEDETNFKKISEYNIPENYTNFHESLISAASFNWYVEICDDKNSIHAKSFDTLSSLYSMLDYRNNFLTEESDSFKEKGYGSSFLFHFFLKKYLCLNNAPGGPYVLMKFIDMDYELHLLFEDGSIYKLPVKLEEYFSLMCKTRGMFMWQAYICEEYPKILLNTEYDGFFENMEHLFPNVDLTNFKHRDKVRRKKTIAQICCKYNYKERFHEVFENLPENLTFHSVNPKCKLAYSSSSIQQIRNVEYHIGRKLPEALKAFYWKMNGLSIKWTANDKDYHKTKQMANFHIASLYEMFGEMINNRIKEDSFMNARKAYEVDKEKNRHLEDKYIFYTDPYCHILLEFVENDKMKVWLHHLESDTRSIELELMTDNFEFIIDRLLDYRGMFFWNLYVTTGPIEDDSIYIQFKSNTEELFPEATYLKE